ncbi:sigma-54-dependent Fis family transcriptional regulator [Marinihelvus fidelis]|uniref:Sigma-54-dependent Fis family transcriptional regulator n=1 Tax=Marinihelvus fidelis TaxID=2613842 RepID=A0A5N0T4P8_9GAMM|nr:sigma-54 dependent transcriptional regulator [Marinihelvus fidelis]KAA9129768.1 sigma-54-dependent Fis family transcriptional regulator [Marinihelvus fidelis]
MDNQHVLIIDDEPDIRDLLVMTLERMGLRVTAAADLVQARRALGANDFSFCLTDMRLPDGNGLDLVQQIGRDHPDLPVAVITAHGRVEDAVQALKLGAFDFVSKPVDLGMLRKLVNTALRLRADDSTPEQDDDFDAANAPAPIVEPDGELSRLIGNSQAMNRCRQMIRKLARSQAPVLISGASGSGKELAARLIHDLGPRIDGPFIPVNCGAIPTELMESEFFGHKKGSFTGADANKEGLFQAADGGTLLLDEVADLPLHMQVKLLRAIQEKAVRPIGAREEIGVDVRILSATHKALKPLVEEGKFRSDLYFRLNVIELHMPSLAERPDDIPALATHFLKNITAEWDTQAPAISPDAMDALQQHDFSGNVRELINILQRAVTMSEGGAIDPDDLMLEQFDDLHDGANGHANGDAPLPGLDADQSLDTYMEDIEKQMLEEALKKARYNKTRAAEQLGISFRSLRYKLKKYGID